MFKVALVSLEHRLCLKDRGWHGGLIHLQPCLCHFNQTVCINHQQIMVHGLCFSELKHSVGVILHDAFKAKTAD